MERSTETAIVIFEETRENSLNSNSFAKANNFQKDSNTFEAKPSDIRYPMFTWIFSPSPGIFFSRLSSRRLGCQGGKAASKQASRPASKQAKKGPSEQASQPASQQASKGASEQTKQASKPASQLASKQARGPASKASKQASKPASQQASKQGGQPANQASKRASEQASKRANQASKQASEQASKRASEQASKGASKGASEQTIFLRGISVRTEVVTSYWLYYTPIFIFTYALYLLALMERKKGIL